MAAGRGRVMGGGRAPSPTFAPRRLDASARRIAASRARWVLWPTLAVLALYALIYGVFAEQLIAYPYELDQGEGYDVWSAWLLRQGQLPYSDNEVFPYFSSNYPPVWSMLAAAVTTVTGPTLAAGRVVSAVAGLACALVVGVAAARRAARVPPPPSRGRVGEEALPPPERGGGVGRRPRRWPLPRLALRVPHDAARAREQPRAPLRPDRAPAGRGPNDGEDGAVRAGAARVALHQADGHRRRGRVCPVRHRPAALARDRRARAPAAPWGRDPRRAERRDERRLLAQRSRGEHQRLRAGRAGEVRPQLRRDSRPAARARRLRGIRGFAPARLVTVGHRLPARRTRGAGRREVGRRRVVPPRAHRGVLGPGRGADRPRAPPRDL